MVLIFVLDSLVVSKDDDFLALPDYQRNLHLILNIECECHSMNTRKIRIFQGPNNNPPMIVVMTRDGAQTEVDDLHIRPGEDGCYGCTAFQVSVTDRSIYKEAAGDFNPLSLE